MIYCDIVFKIVLLLFRFGFFLLVLLICVLFFLISLRYELKVLNVKLNFVIDKWMMNNDCKIVIE